jgi:Arc/MetJ family transcription regulator
VRTTVTIDDELLDQARALTGTEESAVLVRKGLEALVQIETSRRLIALGGSDKHAKAPPRRRTSSSS